MQRRLSFGAVRPESPKDGGTSNNGAYCSTLQLHQGSPEWMRSDWSSAWN
jgi:hypothetical protein